MEPEKDFDYRLFRISEENVFSVVEPAISNWIISCLFTWEEVIGSKTFGFSVVHVIGSVIRYQRTGPKVT